MDLPLPYDVLSLRPVANQGEIPVDSVGGLSFDHNAPPGVESHRVGTVRRANEVDDQGSIDSKDGIGDAPGIKRNFVWCGAIIQ